ncbi:hypothetical protein [Rubidibacter lacunae]|uniref:hypothetical protein n=1 Tax=Rubidibacter lacunae TaxID=582514 RepID=UPI00041AE6C6|nr:hypothetical protein [Rubidibacter lacunae]
MARLQSASLQAFDPKAIPWVSRSSAGGQIPALNGSDRYQHAIANNRHRRIRAACA